MDKDLRDEAEPRANETKQTCRLLPLPVGHVFPRCCTHLP